MVRAVLEAVAAQEVLELGRVWLYLPPAVMATETTRFPSHEGGVAAWADGDPGGGAGGADEGSEPVKGEGAAGGGVGVTGEEGEDAGGGGAVAGAEPEGKEESGDEEGNGGGQTEKGED